MVFIPETKWTKETRDSGVFVQGCGGEVVFVKKGRVQIEQRGKTLFGQTLKATFTLGDKSLSGTISPEDFAKYESWKGESASPTIIRTEVHRVAS